MEKGRKLLIIATTPLCVDGLTEVLLHTAIIANELFTVEFSLGEESEQKILERLKRIGTVFTMPSRKKSPYKYYFALKKLIRSRNYYAVYIHGNSGTMALDLLAAKCGGAPVRITHCHNQAEQSWIRRNTIGKLMNQLTTQRVACSKASGEALYTKPFTVIRNGIDTNRFCFSEKERKKTRDELGVQDAFVIGHIGRFSEQKNHKRLIEIFSHVLDIRPDAKLLLCGTGELLSVVMEQIECAGLKNRVVYCGSSDCPEKYYATMDVFVLPSLFEGFPLVGVEAQASGLPCVFSDTITREADITGNVRFLSLQASDQTWAEEICAVHGTDRNKAAEQVKAAGYDYEDVKTQIRAFFAGLG